MAAQAKAVAAQAKAKAKAVSSRAASSKAVAAQAKAADVADQTAKAEAKSASPRAVIQSKAINNNQLCQNLSRYRQQMKSCMQTLAVMATDTRASSNLRWYADCNLSHLKYLEEHCSDMMVHHKTDGHHRQSS